MDDATTVQRNLQAVVEVADGASGDCPFCQREGLPLLALRYAVVPAALGRGHDRLPGVLGANVHKDQPLKHHRYTVRALRKGYVYVYLNKPGRWQAYAVTGKGNLRLLPDPDDIDARTDREMTPQCERKGDNIPASFIRIPEPAQTPKIWVAFSATSWTRAVRRACEKAPAERMQPFDLPALMAGGIAHSDTLPLADLDDVVEEYATSEEIARQRQRHRATSPDGSKEVVWESCHGYHPRIGQADGVRQFADKYKEQSGRAVSAIVLHDPLGIVQELNESRCYYIGAFGAYRESVRRPLLVSQSIMGLAKVIGQSAGKSLAETEKKAGLPDVQTERIVIHDDLRSMRENYEITTTRKERAQAAARKSWAELAERYDESKRQAFDAEFKRWVERYTQAIGSCDHDWSVWASDPQWIICFRNYDPTIKSQRIALTIDCAQAMQGGAIGREQTGGQDDQSHCSLKVWERWLEAAPDDSENPVYQGLFGNAPGFLQFLDPTNGDNKADDLYDIIKGFSESEDMENVPAYLKVAVVQLQMALAGSIASVQSWLLMSKQTLSESVQNTALVAQQALVMLYERVQIVLLKLEMTVGEYQQLMASAAFKGTLRALGNASQAMSESGQMVRSMSVGGGMPFHDPTGGQNLIDVTLWWAGNPEALQREIDLAIEEGEQAARRANTLRTAEDAAASMALFHAQQRRRLRLMDRKLMIQNRQQFARMSAYYGGVTLRHTARTRNLSRLLVAQSRHLNQPGVGGGAILAAGAVFFQGWALRNAVNDLEQKIGPKAIEAQLGVMSASVGVIAGSTELVGHGLRALGLKLGEKLASGGGLVGAASSVIDAVQSFAAFDRTGSRGDNDAADLYLAAGVLYAGAAFAGVWGALGAGALFGPLGVALVLIAAGVIATWAALNAEDTQVEIWLDRCYFGHGKRGQKSLADAKWSDAELDREFAALNAIMSGLTGKMGFSDRWLGIEERITGFEQIELEIVFANFNEAVSEYEWTLQVRNIRNGRDVPVIRGMYKQGDHAPRPLLYNARPGEVVGTWFRIHEKPLATRKTGSGDRSVSFAVEVNRELFQEATLTVDYWPDPADSAGRAELVLYDEDL